MAPLTTSNFKFVFWPTYVDADSNSGQTVLNVASTLGYKVGNTVTVNSGGARAETLTISSIQNGVSLTMTGNLAYTHTAAQGDAVEIIKDLLTDYGVYVSGSTGMGTPPLQNVVLPYATGDGALYQRTIAQPRSVQQIESCKRCIRM